MADKKPEKKKTTNMPPSYYRGKDKKNKPQKDKDGFIIPG